MAIAATSTRHLPKAPHPPHLRLRLRGGEDVVVVEGTLLATEGTSLHLLLQLADEGGALAGRLPARVGDGEVHERQLGLAVLRLLVDGGLRSPCRHPLPGGIILSQ